MPLKEIWIEKHRPGTLEDIIGNTQAMGIIKKYVVDNNVPHFLFSGDSGVGKTTTALAIAHAMYGTSYKSHFTEINASDENGIDVIRGKIKDIADKSNDKIIFLDEADALTSAAQWTLRRTIEKYADRTRFILSCNFRGKIIQPIQSRLTPIHFSPLSITEMNILIDRICTKENITVSPEVRSVLCRYAKGDARQIINPLEGASMLSLTISMDAIQVFTQTPDLDTCKLIVTTAVSGDFISAREILLTMLINKGFDNESICESILEACTNITFSQDKNHNNRIVATINAIVANHASHMASSIPIVEFSGILSKIAMIQTISSVEQVI
ncbi:MAG: AAA family ATPase [Pedobacter sp.]|uniref:AAA family ATPase n=1 Tax=Pedobacter sp. TaxID=1411316 RepID=UPI003566AB63